MTSPLKRALALLLSYLVTLRAFKLVSITLVTYVFMHHQTGLEKDSIQKIQDLVAANEILTLGIGGLLFTLALHSLRPLTRTSWSDVWAFRQNSAAVPQSLLHGAVIGVITLAAMAAGGYLSYLGFYLRFDEIALSSITILVFSASILSSALIEEYIFRACLEPELGKRLGVSATIAVSTALYVALKASIFDLSATAALNAALLNITLSLFARARGTFIASACLLFALFSVMHFCFSLPFAGQDMPGLLLLRPNPDTTMDGSLGYYLSGGAMGPENSLILSTLLLISLYLPQIRTQVRDRNDKNDKWNTGRSLT